jgi:hypothetical protein
MKARLEATRTAVSCADLEKAIDAEWRAQQADLNQRPLAWEFRSTT